MQFNEGNKYIINSLFQALNFYRQASKNRTSGKTGRNERSSRSHAIFRVEMTGKVENVEGVNDTCSGIIFKLKYL